MPDSSTSSKNSRRITQLDGIRAFAVMAVFLNHSFGTRLLWMGVDLFFILSGFLITGILIESKQHGIRTFFRHFYARRARRILPPYILLLIVTSIFFGLEWTHEWFLYLGLMNLVFAFPGHHPTTLDILWSLAVEEQFYLFWPFVILFLSESALLWAAAAIMFAAPLLRWFCTPLFSQHWAIYSFTPFRMDLLAMGAILAILWRRRRHLIESYGRYGLLLSAASVAVLVLLSRRPGFATHDNTPAGNVWIYELSLFISTGIVLWALGGKGVGVLNLPPVRYIGRISYSFYLIHQTALALVSRSIHERNAAIAAALAVTIAYSSVSWYLMEKPLLAAPGRERLPEPAPIT